MRRQRLPIHRQTAHAPDRARFTARGRDHLDTAPPVNERDPSTIRRERRRRSTDHAPRRPARHPPNGDPPTPHERDPRTIGRPRCGAAPPYRPQLTRPADPHPSAGRDRERTPHRPDRVRHRTGPQTRRLKHRRLANPVDAVLEHPCAGGERDERPVPTKRWSLRNTEPAVLTDPIGPDQPDGRPRENDRAPIR